MQSMESSDQENLNTILQWQCVAKSDCQMGAPRCAAGKR